MCAFDFVEIYMPCDDVLSPWIHTRTRDDSQRQQRSGSDQDYRRPPKMQYSFTVGGMIPPDRPFFLYHGAVLALGKDTKQKFRVLGNIAKGPKKTGEIVDS